MRAHRILLIAGLLLLAAPVAGAAQDTLSLPRAARAALETHPHRALPAAALDGASAAVREARSALLPRLVTEWIGTRHQEPMIVRPLHGFDPQSPPEFDRSLLQGGVSAGWVLFDGGARGARIGRARAAESAAEATLRRAEADLLARVTSAYLSVLDARAVLAAHDAQVEALEAERTRALRFEAEGRVPHVAVLRAEAALSATRAERVARTAQRSRAEAELARLIGVGADAVAGLALAPAGTMGDTPQDRAALLARALDANPRVEEARLRVAGAGASVEEARSAWLPSVTVGGRYNAYGSADTELTAEWQGGVQLSYPLFTGGQRAAAVARAEAERTGARHALRLAELEVEADVDAAWTTVLEADARVEALEAAVVQFREVVAVEQLALDAGAGVQTDFLRARASLLETETALSTARHARVAARVLLARAAGALDMDWLNGNR